MAVFASVAGAAAPVSADDGPYRPLLAQSTEGGESERSEADLMMDALTAERGEPPSAGRIKRLVAAASAEARRRKVSAPRLVTYWRDPFADDPNRPIPLRPQVVMAMQLAAARREAAHARAEAAAARVDAAAARAEVVRTRNELAAARGGTRRGGETDRSGCAQPTRVNVAFGAERPTEDESAARRARLRRLAARRARILENALAQNERRETRERRTDRTDQPPAAARDEQTDAATAELTSNDPRGIVIVPINSPPPSAAPPRHAPRATAGR
jgi:hypothetical protein